MGEDSKLPRRAAIARILAERQDTLVVTGLGSSTYDCAAVGDHSFNFYLWGAMGSAVTVGLGLALAQPKTARLGNHWRRRNVDGLGSSRDGRCEKARQFIDCCYRQ